MCLLDVIASSTDDCGHKMSMYGLAPLYHTIMTVFHPLPDDLLLTPAAYHMQINLHANQPTPFNAGVSARHFPA